MSTDALVGGTLALALQPVGFGRAKDVALLEESANTGLGGELLPRLPLAGRHALHRAQLSRAAVTRGLSTVPVSDFPCSSPGVVVALTSAA